MTNREFRKIPSLRHDVIYRKVVTACARSTEQGTVH